MAATAKNAEAAEALMKGGASTEAKDNVRETPLEASRSVSACITGSWPRKSATDTGRQRLFSSFLIHSLMSPLPVSRVPFPLSFPSPSPLLPFSFPSPFLFFPSGAPS
eukprot:2204858-Rhodomonas_salina.1